MTEITEDTEQFEDNSLYRSLIGSLMYIGKQTRPDILNVVNTLSCYLEKPTLMHWAAGKRVLWYVQGTSTLKLTFPRDAQPKLQGETDADWSGDLTDRRSTTGYYFKLSDEGGAVSWNVKK